MARGLGTLDALGFRCAVARHARVPTSYRRELRQIGRVAESLRRVHDGSIRSAFTSEGLDVFPVGVVHQVERDVIVHDAERGGVRMAIRALAAPWNDS